jgi:hypothetical protein
MSYDYEIAHDQARAEIRRLHQVCRAKDKIMKDCISLLTYYKCSFVTKLSIDQLERTENVIKDLENSIT